MSAVQAALLIAAVATSFGLLSCDTPRDPPKVPKPVTALPVPEIDRAG